MILGTLFWWNPVVWWARRELRILQESCCDRMVLATDSSQRHRYAEALLKTIDFVASDDAAFPSLATAFASCATFKRRLEMIVSETPNRVISRWLQAGVLLCATVVLSVGVTYAQDYEAVGKRLRAAVAAGELTGEQARAMLATLRKAGGAKKDQEPDRAREYLMKVRKELGAAVEAGKISEEDAKKKYQAAEKAVKERTAAGRGEGRTRTVTREHYARVEAKLKKLVAEGRITAEEGRAKMEAMRKMAGERSEGDARKIDWEGIKRRIEGAVQRGDITREQAHAKYKAIKERMKGAGGEGGGRR